MRLSSRSLLWLPLISIAVALLLFHSLSTDSVLWLSTYINSPNCIRSDSKIPLKIHITTNRKTFLIKYNIIRWQTLNPCHEIYIYNDDDVRNTFVDHLPKLLPLFDFLYSPVEKIDFWRYMIIYLHGGVYVDSDVTPVAPIDQWVDLIVSPNDNKEQINVALSVELGNSNQTYWIMQQAVLYGPPKHEIFENCIALIKENVNKTLVEGDLMGTDAVDRTGPYVFTKAVYKYLQMPFLNMTGMKAYQHKDVAIDLQDRFFQGDIVVHRQTGTWRRRDEEVEQVFQRRLSEWKEGKWPDLNL